MTRILSFASIIFSASGLDWRTLRSSGWPFRTTGTAQCGLEMSRGWRIPTISREIVKLSIAKSLYFTDWLSLHSFGNRALWRCRNLRDTVGDSCCIPLGQSILRSLFRFFVFAKVCARCKFKTRLYPRWASVSWYRFETYRRTLQYSSS